MKNNPFKTSEEFLYGQSGGAGRVIDVEVARQEAELPDLSGDMGEDERQRKIEAVRNRRLNLARAAAQMVFSKDIDLMDDLSRAGLYRASTKALFGFEDTDGRIAFGKKAGDMKSNLERLRLFLKGDVSQIEDEDVAAWRKLHGADEETRFRHADKHLKGKGSRDWDNGPSSVELAGAGMPGAQFGNFMQNAAAPTKDAATRKMRYKTMNDDEKAAFRADTIRRYERQIASANPLNMFLKTLAGISDEAAWTLAKCFQSGNVDVKDIEAIRDGKEREKVLTALSMMRGDKKVGHLLGFIPQDFEDGTDFGNRIQMNIYGIQQAFAGLVTDVWDLGEAGIDELKIYAKGLKDTEEAREMRKRTDLEAQIAAALRQKLPDADSFMGALSQGVAENVHWIVPYVGPFSAINKGKAALKGVKTLKGALALDEMGAAAKGVKAAAKGIAVAKSEAALARQMAALELYTERLRELYATADAALKAMPEATQALAKSGVAAKARTMIAAGRTAAFSSFANDYIETADAEGISRAESVPSAVFVGVINQAIERFNVPGLDRTITPAELKSLALRSAVEAFRHERSAGLRKWVADSVAIRAREMGRTVATEALTEEPLQQFTTQMALEVNKTIDELKKEGRADLANVFGELWGKIGVDGFGKAWRLYFDTVQESLPAAVGFGVTGVAMQRGGQMWRNSQERKISGDTGYDEGIVDVLQRERSVWKMMAAHWMKDGGKMEEARNAVNEMFSKARAAYKMRKAGDDTVRLVANAAGVDRKTAEVLHDCLEIEESMALYSPRFRAEVNLADAVMDIDEKKLKAVLPEYVEGSFLADKEKGLYSARLNLPNGEEKTLVYRVGDMSEWIDEQIGEGGLADDGELADSYEARRREMPEGAMKPWSELSDAERRDIVLQGADGFLSGRAGVFEFGGADGQKVTVRADDVISLASGRIADVGYVGAQATGGTLRHETFHALWRFAKGTLSKEDIEALYSHFPDLDPAAPSDRQLDERMAVEFERYASGNFVPLKVRGTLDRFAGWAMDKLGKLLDAVGVRRDGVTDPVTGKAYTLSDFYDKALKGELGSGEQAGNDAKILIDNNLLPRMAFRADGRIDETKCADAIGKFRQESGAQGLVGEDGMLTEEGATRIQNAALAALLGGTGNNALLGRIMENAGRLDMASQLRAFMKVTPELMSLAKTKPEFDIRDALAEALTLYTEWREKDEEKRSEKGKSRHDWRELDKEGKRKRGLSWEAFMSQGDMFRTPSEEAKILGDLFARTEQLRSFDREDVESAAGKKRVVDLITDYLTDYIENARNVNTETEDMFGGTPASRAEVLAAQRAKGESGARFSIAPDENLIQYATGKGNYYGRDQRANSRGYGEGLASEGVQRAIAEIIAARRTAQAIRGADSQVEWEPGREITEIAKRNGCFIELDEFKNLIANDYRRPDFVGGEHQVWETKDGKHLIKANGFFGAAEKGEEPIEVFDRYALHNQQFKNCAYELLGFTELDRTPYFVLRQPNIANAREANASEIEKYLTERGYVSAGGDSWKNDDGIVLGDVVSNNVLVNDRGDVFVIDATLWDAQSSQARFSIGGLYTGSAADYEKPSLHYVGTGEGSQVYGWGLYGSNRREVAEMYARAEGAKADIIRDGKAYAINGDGSISDKVAFGLRAMGSAEALRKQYEAMTRMPDRKVANDARVELGELNAHKWEIKKRSQNIYEQTFFTDRAPGDESHLLKWYEPVSEEQSRLIFEQAEREGIEIDYNFVGTDGLWSDGAEVYSIITDVLGSPKAASEFLARAGIDGVKYPVNSYRKKVRDGDEAGWNYVSFRDDNIRVDHKWVDGEQRFSIATLGKYRTDDLRSLAHRVKDGDAEAIAEAGRRLAVIMPPDAVLVPMPSHTGEPTTMRLLADAIAANANGAKVVDALRSNAHESNYAQKKRGEEPAEIEMRKVADIPENAEVYIVDNVIDTGATYFAAMKAIPNAHILALADTDRTPEELRSTFKQNIDKILSRFDEAKGLSKEDIFKKFDNTNLEIGSLPNDLHLPQELSVAKRTVKAAEAYVLDHLHNKPHHAQVLTADDARRMLSLINPNNEMRIVPQRSSSSLAFIAANPSGGWDCVVIAPRRGEFYVFKTMFAQKRKPYQDKSQIRYSIGLAERGNAVGSLIRGLLTSIRDIDQVAHIISNSLSENNGPSAELLEAMGRKAADEKKNAGKGGKFQPARRASMSFAYPNLAWMSNEELLSAAVAAKMALGKSDKVSDRNTTINEVQRKVQAIHPDWDSTKVSVEAQRILGEARKLSKEIRGDIDKGVSDSLILEHLPQSMRTVFGEEMTGEARRGWRLGMFQAKAEAGVQRKVAEAQERLMRDALEIETGMMHGDIERGFGVDLAATLLKVKENEYLKVVPKSSGGEAGAASGEVETMGESVAEDAFSADETVEEVKPKVSALVQAIAKRAEAKAEEESEKRKANRERAEKRVGNEDINDGKDAEPDTGDFAGGEISPEEVVEEAVKAGADLNNPLSFALFVMEMARVNWVKKHNLNPDAEPKHSLVYIQFQRKTLQDVYSTLARRVTYSRGRETVMNALHRLDKVTTMRGLIREAEFMGKLVGAKMIRESAQAMCERLDNLLKTEFQTGRQFKPDEESLNRKVPAMLERQARYMRHAMWLTPDGVSEETRTLLQEKALAGSEFDEHGADKSVSRVIDEADMKLKILADWGALKYKDLATVEAAVQWWLNAAEGGADAIAQAWDVREARTLKAAGVLAKAVRNPKRKTAVDGKSWMQTANEIFQGHMLFHHLLEDLTRFAGEEDRAAAMRYIDWLDLEIQKAGTRVASERIKMQDEMRKAVEQIYGRKFRDVVSELSALDGRFDAFMGAADDGVNVPGTKGRAMQLLVSLQQIGYAVEIEDEENPGQMKTVYMGGYYDNIVENGRVGQAEELLKLMSPADLNFIKWLRQWYERNRKGISDVSERIFGVGVMAELGNYMPVKMLLDPKGLENGAGATWQIFPKALTPRVRNKRDFDTSVDILTMWSGRLEESIQWKHHVELGIELRGIFGRSELQKAIRANHGVKVLSLVKGFITDILNGKGEKQEMMVNPMIDRARQFAALGGLGGNVGVMLKQTTSIPAFGFEIGVWRTFGHLVGTLTPQGWVDVRKVAQSEEFRNRWQDGYSEEVQNALSSENPGLLMRLWMKSMVTNKVGDCVPALLIGHGIYRDGIEQGLSEQDAMARMWMIVERTQQSSRIENRTAFQRRNALGNAIYQFLSAQNQILNYEVRALRDAVADPKNAKKWGKFVRDATLVHFVLSTFYYWMGELYKKMLGQEPSEDQLKDWVVSIIVGPVGALYGVGTTTVDAVESWVKGYSYGSSNAVPALNWLGQVVVRDPAILIHDIFNGKKSWDDVCDDMLRWLSDFNATFRDARKFYRFRIKEEKQKKRK